MTGLRTSLAPRSAAAKTAAALVCLSLYIFIQVLGASQFLHRVYHPDADDTHHQCVVTLVASGQLLAPVTGAFLHTADTAVVLDVRPPEQILGAVPDRRLLPERAPPFFFA